MYTNKSYLTIDPQDSIDLTPQNSKPCIKYTGSIYGGYRRHFLQQVCIGGVQKSEKILSHRRRLDWCTSTHINWQA